MPLVIGLVAITGAILLLTSGITDASFADVIAGKAGELFRQNQPGATSTPTPASTAPGAKNTTPPGAVGKVTTAMLETIGAAHGWSGQQITDWMNVVNQESGGNPNAVNASSGASGIAQFINGFGEYAQYGGSASSVTGQLTAMANYIAQRYGNPSAAWAHEQANNWY